MPTRSAARSTMSSATLPAQVVARAGRRRQPAARARPARSSRWTCRNRWRSSAIAAFARKDDDFIAAYVLNYIIGGGGFSSRLMEEVREKRGLAYSVHSNLYPFQHGAVFVGNVATKNEAVGQSLASDRERAAGALPSRVRLPRSSPTPRAISPAPTRSASNRRQHRQPAARGSRSRISASTMSTSATR